MRRATIAALTALVACSHDADRANPLDPQRTPAVEVTLAVDTTAGRAAVGWTAYSGAEPFGAYLVLRNVARSTDTDTLARIDSVGRTAFVDTTMDLETAYQYRVAVITTAGYVAHSDAFAFEGFSARPVLIVSALSDSTLGTIELAWNRYRGPAFIAYELHRRRTGTDADSIVATATGIGDTVFVDHGARHGQRYNYHVVVRAGDRELAGLPVEAGVQFPAVDILQVRVDATTASAQVSWRPYAGTGFVAYRVERDAGSGFVPIATIVDAADTSLVDGDLHGNTTYDYRIVTRTESGDEFAGEPSAGAFHSQVDSWSPFVRNTHVHLQSREDGGVYAFAADEEVIRLLEFDSAGRMVKQVDLFAQPTDPKARPVVPQSVSGHVLPDGSVAVAASAISSFLLRYDSEGQPQSNPVNLFEGIALPGDLPRAPRGVISIVSNAVHTDISVDDIVVRMADAVVFEETFSNGQPESWHIVPEDGVDNRTTVTRRFDDGRAAFQGGDTQLVNGLLLAQKVDLTWEDFVLGADVLVFGGVPGLRIGGGFGSTVHLKLDLIGQRALLHWIHTPRPGTDEERYEEEFETPFPVVPGLWLGVELSAGGDAPLVTIQSPVQHVIAGAAQYTTVQSIGDVVTFTGGGQPVSLNGEDPALTYAELDVPPSATRIWASGRAFVMGATFPASHTVSLTSTAVNRATGRVTFPGAFSKSLGGGAGAGPGQFLFPVSIDAGPDGRIYVLDAANSRVQVFDEDGEYITQWGRFGSDPGEFDFSTAGGTGFGGSIAVDDDGFIYVADVGNNRIQKFAP